jgi:type III pantothenate kinase
MLLLVEVGNTNTGLGVADGDRLVATWRLTTRREQTPDEYGMLIHTLLRGREIEPRGVTAVAISNVVPPVQQTLEQMARTYFGVEPFTVQPGVNVPLAMRVDAPREVGADRMCNAVAAAALYGPPLVVVDFGTATNFDCVNAQGEFVGGAIAPGLVTAAEALIARAARLYRVELVAPPAAIGRNTATNIQSGVVLGYAGLVDGLVERIRAELGGSAKVIGTGGLAPMLATVARSLEIVNPHLRLEGLRLIWERARG